MIDKIEMHWGPDQELLRKIEITDTKRFHNLQVNRRNPDIITGSYVCHQFPSLEFCDFGIL